MTNPDGQISGEHRLRKVHSAVITVDLGVQEKKKAQQSSSAALAK
jgi:hypothetical protein